MNFDSFLSGSKDVLTSKIFLFTFAALLSISLSVVYVTTESWSQEKFLAMSTIGNGMKAGNYFPNTNSSVSLDDNVQWYVNVYNHMGHSQYVSLRMYILNATQSSFIDSTSEPSQKQQIFEFRYLLKGNSTIVVPINWEITQISEDKGYVVINGLKVNDKELRGIEVQSVPENDFKMLIELWRHNTENEGFLPTENKDDHERYAWNQIWFKINA